MNTKAFFTSLYNLLEIVGDEDYEADRASANTLIRTREFSDLLKSVKAIDTRHRVPKRPDVWPEERSRRYIKGFAEVHKVASSEMPGLLDLQSTHKNAVSQKLWDKYVVFAKEVIKRVVASSWYTGDDEALDFDIISDSREVLPDVMVT